jgi:hypothetical protein
VEQKQSMPIKLFSSGVGSWWSKAAEFSAGIWCLEEDYWYDKKEKELKLLYSRRSYFKNYKFRNDVIKMLKELLLSKYWFDHYLQRRKYFLRMDWKIY